MVNWKILRQRQTAGMTVNCLEGKKSSACKAVTNNLGEHGKHLPSIRLQAERVFFLFLLQGHSDMSKEPCNSMGFKKNVLGKVTGSLR